MKGIMKVSRLNKSGLYISELNWDKCYQGKNNPKGYFVMIIEPLEGWEKGIIYYEKEKNGYLIEGEGYIVEGNPSDIKENVKKRRTMYKTEPFEYIKAELSEKNDDEGREL